ncbi:PREDICTED: LOW QUALITY PROTEIN: TOM1-like protein 2 [Priapulus caudatus]|uniref:LOW QUALITY PROTEIN: TOM1-like protein 2 n=1 Tax=Priapulus caudatus TaxID=37621 RepID=A0ABM1DTD9_PRICU|nr:PREDICTED: LOW QUALITY PROTEIN: TOM1-like protein 2 [Priapulus caudatus]
MSFFQTNPFATPVGQRIERGTDASLASEDWALNMEICDIIMETEDGAKDAVKAIRKRLQSHLGKNYNVIMFTLTVLETCVKNCGHRFHVLVMQKDFIGELVKVIGPKNDPPTAVQEKVLSVIQTWADAFKGQPDCIGVVQVYNELKSKGIEFPMTDLDNLAPIHTPQRSIPETELTAPIPQPPRPQAVRQPPAPAPLPAQHSPPGTIPGGPINPTPEQLAKLRSELDIVMGNMRVFGEMLTELQPGRVDPADLELLQELYPDMQDNADRIVELIDKVANEEVTSELLHVNDNLNNVFLRYDRFERYRTGLAAQATDQSSPQQTQVKLPVGPAGVQRASEAAALIDFGDDSSQDTPPQTGVSDPAVIGVTQQMGSVEIAGTVPGERSDEFDMFAQTRQTTYEQSRQGGSSYADNTDVDQYSGSLGAAVQARHAPPPVTDSGSNDDTLQDKPSEYEEMESWLKTEDAKEPQQGAMTSAEFDRFLESRARAVEELPSVGQNNGQRGQLSKKDETENALFAL